MVLIDLLSNIDLLVTNVKRRLCLRIGLQPRAPETQRQSFQHSSNYIVASRRGRCVLHLHAIIVKNYQSLIRGVYIGFMAHNKLQKLFYSYSH